MALAARPTTRAWRNAAPRERPAERGLVGAGRLRGDRVAVVAPAEGEPDGGAEHPDRQAGLADEQRRHRDVVHQADERAGGAVAEPADHGEHGEQLRRHGAGLARHREGEQRAGEPEQRGGADREQQVQVEDRGGLVVLERRVVAHGEQVGHRLDRGDPPGHGGDREDAVDAAPEGGDAARHREAGDRDHHADEGQRVGDDPRGGAEHRVEVGLDRLALAARVELATRRHQQTRGAEHRGHAPAAHFSTVVLWKSEIFQPASVWTSTCSRRPTCRPRAGRRDVERRRAPARGSRRRPASRVPSRSTWIRLPA